MSFVTCDRSFIYGGRTVFISADRFIEEICLGDCCFICGVSRERAANGFNGEHVLPDWVLTRYGLHGQSITLPNLTDFKYSEYLIPCCRTCNSRMGAEIEKPISDAFALGPDKFVRYLLSKGTRLLFRWLSLIFLKTHLKDAKLRANRDRRVDAGMIGDIYDWPKLHHVHAVARSHYSGARLSNETMGTLFVLRLKDVPADYFDFMDNFPGRTIGICLGESAILAVLDDACGVFNVLSKLVSRLNSPLSPLEFRELGARCSYGNIRLKDRPVFRTESDTCTGESTIVADIPAQAQVEGVVDEELGQMIEFWCNPILKRAESFPNGMSLDEVLTNVRGGKWTFLTLSDAAE